MKDPHLSGRILFFSDIDDTLVNTDKSLSDENRTAIREFLERDHIFVISTGRALSGARNLLTQLGLYGKKNLWISSSNGAIVYDTFLEKELLRHSVPRDLMLEAFDLAREFGIHIQTYTDTSVVSETDNESLRIYLDNQKLPLILVPHIKDAQIAPPPKLLCLDYQDPEKVTRFRSYFERQMGGRLDCFQSNPWLLEIVPPGVNKGSSLRFIAEKTGIPIDHTISAGDAENDLSMILAAGIGCAMRNADESLKQQADYVTEHDNNHAGIAEILYRFCL
jgi:Cof subfamily protein (haloacid dehalogenase superfamily)